MGHIRYAGDIYNLPEDEFADVRQRVFDALKNDQFTTITIKDPDGDLNTLAISRGIGISFHDWDAFTASDLSM
ncbi:hypothetical protein [Glutamicibacter sp. NPDC090743]|uniref:hypothetical protein n=1 Tax=Glutamicibacter sp. NPDC090743 TaxID=3364001 RepID=UPI0037FCAF06